MSRVELRHTLPRPSKAVEEQLSPEVLTYFNKLVTILIENMRALAETDATGWRPSNVPSTGNRDIDASTATLDETRKCLARLIQDLKDAGVLAQ